MNMEKYTKELELKEDGIWYSSVVSSVAYPSGAAIYCFEVEDQSFWFKHRNKCITAAIKNFPPEINGVIFDIGGGNGVVARDIQESGFEVVLVEPGKDGARNARKRGIKNIICSTLQDAKFSRDSLSAIGTFDVIEHIENDVAFLQSINRVLAPNGRLYITVPAYQFLWSLDDELGGHYRRYTISEITEKLTSTGFNVDYSTYIFRFLPLPIFFLRTIPYKFGVKSEITERNKIQSDHSLSSSFVQKQVQAFLKREIHNIENKSPMRFGGSCLIVASKKTDL
jgi:SAM-dependent methyltransferase